MARALQESGTFKVRALTRNPASHQGPADEVVHVDLTRPETLEPALSGVYGMSTNTNSFDQPDTDEVAQATAATLAANAAGVEHYVWSTLPDVETISEERFVVPHFTNKASANKIVSDAGFTFHTS